jgi:L,D-transpeptidase ErfK/SrfK
LKRLFIFVIMISIIFVSVTAVAQQVGYNYRIIIDLPRYSLTLYEGEQKIKEYPIAIGKPQSATPVGSYAIINKAVNPTWHPNSSNPVPPGPNNPLGIRWLGFFRGYGIHGNNSPQSIGTSVSLGCIRMYNYDVAELYSMVEIGIPVEIMYDGLIDNADEPVIIAHRDIYSRVGGYRDSIIDELSSIGLDKRIPEQKLQNLFKGLDKGTVVFAESWVLKVNGIFLTADTIYDRTMVFVNADKLNQYFGINILWDYVNNTGNLMGYPVSAYNIDGRLYASIADIRNVLGGRLVASTDLEELDYRINFAKLDGLFLTSDIADFTTSPKINIARINPAEREMVGIERLKDYGIEYNVLSRYGYIELLSILPEGK